MFTDKEIIKNIVFCIKYCRSKEVFKKQINCIIEHDYKFIYFYIPKVACSSIKTYIANLLHKDLENIHDEKKFNFIRKEEVENKSFNEYFKFTFVRNPWDRVVSCYLNKISNPLKKENISHRGKEIFSRYYWWKPDMTFKEFVIAIYKTPERYSEGHFKSQYSFVYSKKGKLMVDFVGKFEKLDQDFEYVCKKLNIKNTKLPIINSTPRKHYSEYYDQETKKMISEKYEKDIKYFGYVFENFKKDI